MTRFVLHFILAVALVSASPIRGADLEGSELQRLTRDLEFSDPYFQHEIKYRWQRRLILLSAVFVVGGVLFLGSVDVQVTHGRVEFESYSKLAGGLSAFMWFTDLLHGFNMEISTVESKIVQLKRLIEEERNQPGPNSEKEILKAERVLEKLRAKGYDVDGLTDEKSARRKGWQRAFTWTLGDKLRAMTYAGGCSIGLERLVAGLLGG